MGKVGLGRERDALLCIPPLLFDQVSSYFLSKGPKVLVNDICNGTLLNRR